MTRIAIRFALFVCLGGALMFVGHLFAFASSINRVPAPYWWSYVILYPLAGVLAVRRGALSPVMASIAVCLLPAAYFTAIGIADGNWHTSSTAIVGVCISFAITLLCATWSERGQHGAFSAP